MDDKQNNERQISFELKPEIAKGAYANLAVISHSKSEFVIDFATILPGVPKPEISNRLIMAPVHIKRLLLALGDNVKKYEDQFGVIDPELAPNGGNMFNPGNFGSGGLN